MNVEKMRRQLARNTPDQLVLRVDRMWDNDQVMFVTDRVLEEFGARMRIKHGRRFLGVTVSVDETLNFKNPDAVCYIARVSLSQGGRR